MTARYAVAGNPVAHSQSPFIHQQFAQATGQDLRYGRLLCPRDGFANTVRAFALSLSSPDHELPMDGSEPVALGPALGCNVTVPFKFEAYALATTHTPRAQLAQAANTLRFDEAGWLADNTDGIGLVRDIQKNAGVMLVGRRVLLIGAGGAAAGALGALIEARPAELVLVNRSEGKAHLLSQSHQPWAATHGVVLRSQGLENCGPAYDVVINASSSSLQGAEIPVHPQVLRQGSLALDMMYGPAAQGFMAWAEQHGAQARDGLGMLVEQAAEAFAIWRGMQPETEAVLRLLRERLAANAPAASA